MANEKPTTKREPSQTDDLQTPQQKHDAYVARVKQLESESVVNAEGKTPRVG